MGLVAFFSYVLGGYLLRQITQFTHGAQLISEGNAGTQLEVVGNDEIAQATRAFNSMSQSILRSQEDLESRVLEKTAELELAKHEAETANGAKGQFLANMSHEIRTPMNAVLGMLQLVQRTSLDARQQDYVGKAQSAAKSLLGLLNDILDFSKMDVGKLQLDLRKIYDDKSIDTVSIAAPNHWHALAAVWAMQAGKDAYVEKPVCHNIVEGRRMVDAARKYKRICQGGTQNRSVGALHGAADYLREGKLGDVKLARTIIYGKRGSIGGPGPCEMPPQCDFNLWLGPALNEKPTRAKLHYDWHWVWDTGNGELGNNNIHMVDICRWLLRLDGIGDSALSIGGRVEGRLRPRRFLTLYIASGLVASFGQIALSPRSTLPLIGASGAIAGVLGTFLVLFPKARLAGVLPLGCLVVPMKSRAFLFIPFWFLLQLYGALSAPAGSLAGGTAWYAHLAGFAAGPVLLFLLRRR